jgi:hypothetical protein
MAANLLGLRVRIPLGTWIFFSCKCSSVRGADPSSGGILPNVVVKARYSGGTSSLGTVVPRKKTTYFENFIVGMHTVSINLGVTLKCQAL